ncbi:hypothetical protein SAMN05444162_3425 [Paenibacillaceae bacterium GAS479]|nr:hypothetical protein SAMN05444162_3425 [Paenibacillaceae bacterium GAS479]
MRQHGIEGDLAPYEGLASLEHAGIPAVLILLNSGSLGRGNNMDKKKAAVVRL